MPLHPEAITEDLTAALDAHTKGEAVHPDDLDVLAEFAVGWFEQRGLLAGGDLPPVIFLLTDRWHDRTSTHGLYGSLLDAKIAARTVVASRGRAPAAGDEWALAKDPDDRRCHRWAPIQLGCPIGDFTIHEMTLA